MWKPPNNCSIPSYWITQFQNNPSHQTLAINSSVSLNPQSIESCSSLSTGSGSLSFGRRLNMTSGVVSRIPSNSTITFKSIIVAVVYPLGTKSFSLQMKVLAKPTLSYLEYLIAMVDSLILIPTVSGDKIQYSVQRHSSEGSSTQFGYWNDFGKSRRIVQGDICSHGGIQGSGFCFLLPYQDQQLIHSQERESSTLFLPPFMEIPSPSRWVHCPKDSYSLTQQERFRTSTPNQL